MFRQWGDVVILHEEKKLYKTTTTTPKTKSFY